MERGSWCELVVLTINEKAHICGLSCYQEPRLLCVSFYVSSPSGRCFAETSNFLFLLVLSLHRPIMIGGLAGVEPASEIPTYYLNYNKNNDLLFKTVGWYYSVFVHFTRF